MKKQIGDKDPHAFGEFEQVFAYRDGNSQNKYKDETCTYCNKKGHTEVLCFSKRDEGKLIKMAMKVSSSMAEQIAAINKFAMDSILDRFDKMNLNGYGQLLPPEVAHEPERVTNDESNDQSPTYSRDWLVDAVYYTTRSKPKSDIILLKIVMLGLLTYLSMELLLSS